MSLINYASREINCKLVYYGPGLGGKTTNLEYIYEKVAPTAKGKLISLATETERTLFFDFLPVDLGTIRGFKTRFHLYTVPGQVYYNSTRKLVLQGVDQLVRHRRAEVERVHVRRHVEGARIGIVVPRHLLTQHRQQLRPEVEGFGEEPEQAAGGGEPAHLRGGQVLVDLAHDVGEHLLARAARHDRRPPSARERSRSAPGG